MDGNLCVLGERLTEKDETNLRSSEEAKTWDSRGQHLGSRQGTFQHSPDQVSSVFCPGQRNHLCTGTIARLPISSGGMVMMPRVLDAVFIGKQAFVVGRQVSGNSLSRHRLMSRTTLALSTTACNSTATRW